MALTAIVLFCWQGSIYLLTLALGSFMTPDMMTELSIVGGFLVFTKNAEELQKVKRQRFLY